MAGKARVHELAKELGVTSKQVLARLSEQGEFVKSASSTVEAPVARRLRESFGGNKPAGDKGRSGDAKSAPCPSRRVVFDSDHLDFVPHVQLSVVIRVHWLNGDRRGRFPSFCKAAPCS